MNQKTLIMEKEKEHENSIRNIKYEQEKLSVKKQQLNMKAVIEKERMRTDMQLMMSKSLPKLNVGQLNKLKSGVLEQISKQAITGESNNGNIMQPKKKRKSKRRQEQPQTSTNSVGNQFL